MAVDVRVCRTAFVPSEQDKQFFWSMVDAMLQPLHEVERPDWMKFWRRVLNARAGDVIGFAGKFHRNPKFHRKLFAMLGVGFDAWEPDRGRTKTVWRGRPIIKEKEQFRSDVTIMSGFCDARYALDGSLKLAPRSIAFAKMDDGEFETFYNAVADVLLERVLVRYNRDDLDQVVDELMGFVS